MSLGFYRSLGRPRISATVEKRIQAQLRAGKGILKAQSGHSLRCNAMSAFGGKADMRGGLHSATTPYAAASKGRGNSWAIRCTVPVPTPTSRATAKSRHGNFIR
jgi:hypothetical protein